MAANNLAFSLSSICNQRKRQQLYAPPPVRLELISPYTGQYTKNQLDMRRKAEILKYSNNTSNTKTNNLTKAQRWAQIAKGTGKSSAYTQLISYTLNDNGNYDQVVSLIPNSTCPNDNMIPTPSYACDVPGPIVYLYRDTNVPLYGFATNINSYAITQNENVEPWNAFVSNDIFFPSYTENELFALNIRSHIANSLTTFSFRVPIAIYISSISSITIPSTGLSLKNNTISINRVTMNVYYNGEQVTVPQTYTLAIQPTPLPVFNFDISCNTSNQSFSLLAYAGALHVQNLPLYTLAGYVYDVKLTFNVSYTSSNMDAYNQYFGANNAYGVYCNMSSQNVNLFTQCSLQSNSIIPIQYSQFTIGES